MDFNGVITALLHRWYIVLAGLIVTAGLAVGAFMLVPLTYSATASLLLLPSQESMTPGANPLLQLGGLEQPTSLVVAYLGGNQIHQQFADKYPGATFTVVVDTLGRGPLMIFTADAPTKAGALAALSGAVDLVPGALTALQDSVDAPTAARVRSAPLSIDEVATTVKGTTLRALILATGVGLAMTFTGAVALDSLLARRAQRRNEGQAVEATSAPEVPEAATPEPPSASVQWSPRAVAQRRG